MIPTHYLKAQADELREACKADPLFLAREILGEAYAEAHDGVNYFRSPAPYHYEVNEVLKGLKNAIILAPRGHLKTEFITIAGTIHFLLLNPNHRVLIMSETPETARKALRTIKSAFQDNARLRGLFPEYKVDTSEEEGTQDHMDLACRTGPKGDYSIKVIGVSGATAGGHFDRIVTTDIVSDLTVPPTVTVETMMKTTARVNSLEPLLNKSNKRSHIIIEGTIWADGDPYCTVLSNPGYSHYEKIVYSCWARGKDGEFILGEDGKRTPMWPTLHTTEELERIRAKSVYLFSCYYENDPKPDPTEAMFKPSYFRYYNSGEDTPQVEPGICPCCKGPLKKALTIDPAIGKKRKNDRTAMIVSGVCPRGSLVVVSVKAARVDPGTMVNDLYAMDAADKPDWIGIETVAFQKLFLYILHEESKKPGRYILNMRELKADEQKERRIGMLAAYAASRGIWVRAGDHDELQDECLKMTLAGSMGRHDDLPDCLAYRIQGMGRPDSIEEEAPPPPRALYGASCLLGSEVLDMLEEKAQGGGRNALDLP